MRAHRVNFQSCSNCLWLKDQWGWKHLKVLSFQTVFVVFREGHKCTTLRSNPYRYTLVKSIIFPVLAVVKYHICLLPRIFVWMNFCSDDQLLKTTIISYSFPDAVCGLLPSLPHKHTHTHAHIRATVPHTPRTRVIEAPLSLEHLTWGWAVAGDSRGRDNRISLAGFLLITADLGME